MGIRGYTERPSRSAWAVRRAAAARTGPLVKENMWGVQVASLAMGGAVDLRASRWQFVIDASVRWLADGLDAR